MAGPGEYVPDITEGITRVEDLPHHPRGTLMARLFRLLLLGLVLAGPAGCKEKTALPTAPPPSGGPQGMKESPKPIPLPP